MYMLELPIHQLNCNNNMLAEVHTRTISSFIQTHNLDHHLYAHDTHIYLSLATPDTYLLRPTHGLCPEYSPLDD